MTDHHMTPTEYAEYCRLVSEAMALDDPIKALQDKQARLLAESGEIVDRSLVRAGDPAAIQRATRTVSTATSAAVTSSSRPRPVRCEAHTGLHTSTSDCIHPHEQAPAGPTWADGLYNS